MQIVNGAIPELYFEHNSSVPPAEIAVHVLDYLYLKLDQVCLVQGGEVGISLSLIEILFCNFLWILPDFTVLSQFNNFC